MVLLVRLYPHSGNKTALEKIISEDYEKDYIHIVEIKHQAQESQLVKIGDYIHIVEIKRTYACSLCLCCCRLYPHSGNKTLNFQPFSSFFI